jgi:hypothetical protein
VGETKTTHNLPLPMEAQRVATMYNNARAAVDAMPETRTALSEQELLERQSRSRGWSHVGHPIAQTLGYMILNSCRYGVLTSGSRTYFLHIRRVASGNGEEEEVLISNAWFVGQENYLRAWALFYASSESDNQTPLDQASLSEEWLQSTPEKVGGKRARPAETSTCAGPSRQQINEKNRSRQNSRSHTTIVPTATLFDFKVGPPLGHGRHGTTFSTTWKGEIVAVKVFDTLKNKGMEAFLREIKAYEHLKEAWGNLVPTPKFTAEAFGVIFLGMQMAERPSQTARVEDWDYTLLELEKKYGFRHLDVDGFGRGPGLHNRMILRDGTGLARPIVIDLEEYELVE